MKLIYDLNTRVLQLTLGIVAGVRAHLSDQPSSDDPDRDRGDVPGWVMITLMTAIVVIGLLAVFQNQVIDAVTTAFNSITGKDG